MNLTFARAAAALGCIAYGAPTSSLQPPAKPAEVVEPLTTGDVVKPLTSLVGKAESDLAGGYDAANNGRPLDLGRDGMKKVFGRSAAEVTVGEIQRAQDERRIHAVGRYQIIGITLESLVKARCINSRQLFTKVVQDNAFVCLIQKNRPAIWRFIESGYGIEAAANGMAREWSSMPYAHGRSYYGGADKAHATRAQLFSALTVARSNYAGTLTQQGANS